VRETPRRGAVEHHYRSAPRPEAVLNVELGLDDAGWRAAAAALAQLNDQLERIVARHGGSKDGRIVAALLSNEAG
jgi:hypothetical protein